MYHEEDLLPLSRLQDIVYCERRAALVLLEGQREDNAYTSEGSILHEKADIGDSEKMKNLVRTRGLRLHSFRLGLSGRADIVEFHKEPISFTGDIELGVTSQGSGEGSFCWALSHRIQARITEKGTILRGTALRPRTLLRRNAWRRSPAWGNILRQDA